MIVILLTWVIMGVFMIMTGGAPLPTIIFGFCSGIIYTVFSLATS